MTQEGQGFHRRHAEEQIRASFATSRVVVVNGPRQAGKTTLVGAHLHPVIGGTFVSLDDDRELAACLDDPATFITRPKPLLIDEFQRAGEPLLRAVKLAVDHDDRPGQFVLTGSTRFTTVPTISESLAGRVHIVDLWPFTQGEAYDMGPSADRFLADVLNPATEFLPRFEHRDLPDRTGYLERVCLGGYPLAHRLATRPDRRRFFRNYLRTIAQRDVPEISRVQHIDELPRLLRVLAAITAQELNVSEVSRRVGIERVTLGRNYLPLLRTLYLHVELPSWSRNLVTRERRHPKTYLADTGLTAHLLGVDAPRVAEPTSPVSGPLVETFVVNELVRQASRLEDEVGVTLSHYRSGSGVEVDVVIESDDGRVAGVEVKASASVRSKDFDHLRGVRERLAPLSDVRFVRGVVLYTGSRALSFGDGMLALPLAALWLPTDSIPS